MIFSFSACKSKGSSSEIAQTQSIESKTEDSFSTYVGMWSEGDVSFDKGGLILEISIENEEMKLACSLTSAGENSRIAEFEKTIKVSSIVKNFVKVPYEEDGWGNSGVLELTFNKDYILADFKDVVMDEMADWGFYENTYKLVKNDKAQQSITDGSNEYYKNQPDTMEPTYDTSKASGILAQAGLTEEEFRDICEPLGYQESFSTSHTPTNYEIDYGKDYYSKNPDKEVIAKAKRSYKNITGSLLEHYLDKGYPYDTFEGYLSRNIYAKKGHELIYDFTDEVFEKMQEFPNEYLGKPYAIHMRVSPREYIGSYKYFSGTQISINDLRDDTSNPNIMNDGRYLYYVIFNGTFSTYDGKIGLSFNLISLEKISE